MLIQKFPDIHWLKKQIKDGFSNQLAVDNIPLTQPGWPNVVLNTKTKEAERKDIKGPFSLFLNLSGTSKVSVEGKDFQINNQSYAISNVGQNYDLLIDETEPTETFNIHFGDQFFKEAVFALSHTNKELLDQPFAADGNFLNLSLCTRARNSNMDMALLQLIDAYDQESGAELEEELLFQLLAGVLITESEEVSRLAALPTKSKAAKEEIVTRLLRARDFIHAHYDKTISLSALGHVSCLSKFHFLRLFKALFGQTPYQYQKQLRFNAAIAMYRQGETLESIAPKIGMENASSVSRMFHKQAGAYPSQLVS